MLKLFIDFWRGFLDVIQRNRACLCVFDLAGILQVSEPLLDRELLLFRCRCERGSAASREIGRLLKLQFGFGLLVADLGVQVRFCQIETTLCDLREEPSKGCECFTSRGFIGRRVLVGGLWLDLDLKDRGRQDRES